MRKPLLLTVLLPLTLVVAACEERADKAADKPAAEKPAATQPADETPAAETPASGSGELIWVFEARGNRQCEEGGITLDASRDKLAAARVAVHESACGARTDKMFPAVCGGPTGDILLHRIPKHELDMALQLGFDPAAQAQYEAGNCPGA